jgi:uncharacterized repeat protein (TIGR01451 family)
MFSHPHLSFAVVRPLVVASALILAALSPTIAAPPTITTPATATTPTMEPHWRTAISVRASDDGGESNLTYTWDTLTAAGAATAYDAIYTTTNGTHAAKNNVAMFNRAGSYLLRVTVKDAGGETATSDIPVTISALRLPQVFGDHMILQQGKPIVVWGQDNAATSVTVSIDANTATTTTGYTNGAYSWKVSLPPMPADGLSHTMTVSGSSTVSFNNIMIGEVWLASGQSNMDWAVKDSTNSASEIAAANYPNIRFLKVPNFNNATAQDDLPGVVTWSPVSPATVAGFSGAGYYFSRDLHAALNVPVGILQSAVPGTPIEPWTSVEGYNTVPSSVYAGSNPYPSIHRLHNWMIKPLSPFAIKGALWYQGEANHNEGARYIEKMKALINGWRHPSLWNNPALPVYFVQIGPFAYASEGPEVLPEFWEAQEEAARLIPHTGMAVINDISSLELHPRNKQDVGKRLSLLALSNTYGHAITDSGPRARSVHVQGTTLRITFDDSAGLASRDGAPLNWFELRDADGGGYVAATATIDGESVVLSAPGVPNPDSVRFAWNYLAKPNLTNAASLPAGAFRRFVNLRQTASAASVVAGQPLTLTLTATNPGTTAATGVTVAVALPSADFVSATASQGAATWTGSGVSWNVGTLGAGASVNVSIQITGTTAGTLTATSMITGSGFASNIPNNTVVTSTTVTPALTDSLGDGIPDTWRATHFGGDGTTPSKHSATTADPDGDGIRNLVEYATRSDPNSVDISPFCPPAPVIAQPGAAPAHRFTFPYRAEIIPLSYVIQRSPDLTAWSDIYRHDCATGQSTATGNVTGTEDPTTQTITITDRTIGPKYFWRLSVEPEPST